MKRIGIEALLEWAYRRELPKAVPDARTFAPVMASGGLDFMDYAAIDNLHGVVVDFTADGPPHPDALLVSGAVKALDGWAFSMPDDWNPVSDLGLSGAEAADAIGRGLDLISTRRADGERVLRGARSMSMMVINHALLGGCPVWEADRPERHTVCGANGKGRWFRMVDVKRPSLVGMVTVRMEVDGFNQKSRRPFADAYQKVELDPDPAQAVATRAEYELWRNALDGLVEDLAGRMSEHEAMPSTRANRPWEDDTAAGAAVLRDLRTGRSGGWQHSKCLRFLPITDATPYGGEEGHAA